MFDFIKKLFGKSQENEEDTSMKYLIAGLGNMAPDYDDTRHNIGFDVVDSLARKFDVTFKNDTHGNLAEFKHKGKTFILLN